MAPARLWAKAMRFGEDDFEFISGPGVPWALYQFRKGEFVSKLSHPQEFLFQVQGPKAVFTAPRSLWENCYATSDLCVSATS